MFMDFKYIACLDTALLRLLPGNYLLGRKGGHTRDHSMYIYSMYTWFTDNILKFVDGCCWKDAQFDSIQKLRWSYSEYVSCKSFT